jgi:hypothetical protein
MVYALHGAHAQFGADRSICGPWLFLVLLGLSVVAYFPSFLWFGIKTVIARGAFAIHTVQQRVSLLLSGLLAGSDVILCSNVRFSDNKTLGCQSGPVRPQLLLYSLQVMADECVRLRKLDRPTQMASSLLKVAPQYHNHPSVSK